MRQGARQTRGETRSETGARQTRGKTRSETGSETGVRQGARQVRDRGETNKGRDKE